MAGIVLTPQSHRSSDISSMEFMLIVPWNPPHIAEHSKPDCIQLHLLVHSSLQLHEMRLRSYVGVASILVGTGLSDHGSTPLCWLQAVSQPFLLNCKCTLCECCSAAALVGGRDGS